MNCNVVRISLLPVADKKLWHHIYVFKKEMPWFSKELICILSSCLWEYWTETPTSPCEHKVLFREPQTRYVCAETGIFEMLISSLRCFLADGEWPRSSEEKGIWHNTLISFWASPLVKTERTKLLSGEEVQSWSKLKLFTSRIIIQ